MEKYLNPKQLHIWPRSASLTDGQSLSQCANTEWKKLAWVPYIATPGSLIFEGMGENGWRASKLVWSHHVGLLFAGATAALQWGLDLPPGWVSSTASGWWKHLDWRIGLPTVIAFWACLPCSSQGQSALRLHEWGNQLCHRPCVRMCQSEMVASQASDLGPTFRKKTRKCIYITVSALAFIIIILLEAIWVETKPAVTKTKKNLLRGNLTYFLTYFMESWMSNLTNRKPSPPDCGFVIFSRYPVVLLYCRGW